MYKIYILDFYRTDLMTRRVAPWSTLSGRGSPCRIRRWSPSVASLGWENSEIG